MGLDSIQDGIGFNIGKGVQAKKQLRAAKNEQNRITQDRERGLWSLNQMDWQPELASNRAQTYQRSQSPVADAFLGSLLTGSNDQAIQSTRAGAPQAKAQAQNAFAKQYGGWDQLRQQDAAMRQSTPWELKPLDRQVSKPDLSDEAYMSDELGYLDPKQLKILQANGFGFKDGRFRTKHSGKTSKEIASVLGIGNTSDAAGSQGQQMLQAMANYLMQGNTLDSFRKNMGKGKLDVDQFIGQYNPQQPAGGRTVRTVSG